MKYLPLILLSFCLPELKASHTVSSHFEYKFIGKSNNTHRYRISLFSTRDCEPGSVVFPSETSIGIYYKDTRKLYKEIKLRQLSLRKSGSCYNKCLEEIVYESLVDLPVNDSGYFVTNVVCCRVQSSNLRNDQNGLPHQGTTAYCFIPGRITNNSALFSLREIFISPVKTDTIPFHFYNKETDTLIPDSINIRFVAPITGASIANNYPTPQTDMDVFQTVGYNNGFSVIYPLGTSSILKIENGKLIIKCVAEGNYFIAFEVTEYRNDTIIGKTNWETSVYVTNGVQTNTRINLEGWPSIGPKAVLTWDYCRYDIVSQVLERRTDNTGFEPLVFLHSATRGYNDETVMWDTTYHYRVKGIRYDSSVIYSDTVDVAMWTAGIKETSLGNRITIYPVPAGNTLAISFPGVNLSALSILDHTGRVIETRNIEEEGKELLEIDCSAYSPGIYNIRFTTAGGEIFTKRFTRL